MRLLLFGLVSFFSTISLAYAQSGKVEITKDPKIDVLIARRLELSKKGQSAAQIEGYRIQIYSGSDRKLAYAEQTRFKGLYPQIFAYITYIQPNYKVRVGDFRTRMDAEKFMYSIKQNFSTVFIFPDQVSPR
ncbi:MAG: preprotein translocase [Sphingobacteriales bacterium]|nr:preprotein translocase [Sphingobacteriales bacterium]